MICSVISNELVERKALKFYLSVNLELERNSVDGAVTTTTPYLHSLLSVVLESSDLEEQFQTASDRLKHLLKVFQGEGSGFSLKSILECSVNVATYDVIGASSFIQLPAYIQNKKATVKIKNSDEKCFLFCLSYIRKPSIYKEPNQPYHYKKDLKNFNVEGLKFPLPVKQIPKFENQNPEFSVSVYAVDEEKEKTRVNKVNLFPIYTSPHRNRKHHANLLLIHSGQKSHYVVITSLSKLLKGRIAGGENYFVCKFCLYSYTSEILLEKHEDMCSQHPAQKTVFPTPGENIMKFKNFGNSLEVPFTIYADFETLVIPNDDAKKTKKHVPSGVSCSTVSKFPEFNRGIFSYTGPDVMEKFFEHLDSERKRIDEILRRNPPMKRLSPDQLLECAAVKSCRNCDVKFDNGVHKRCFHHCHVSGEFLYMCCGRCNLLLKYKQTVRKTKKTLPSFEVPVFFHNLTGFDGHFILKYMNHIGKKDKTDCIGTSSEKLLTFSYHGFKFLDTCNFLKALLGTLTNNSKDAGIDKFAHTKRVFGDKFELLLRKGVYAYDYMDSFERFNETSLPPREAFYNTLTESDISEEDYEYALKIWKAFECETIHDFHTLYMKCDVALICDVFEHFCKIDHSDYKLDPKYYITLPSFSFDAMLKLSRVELELLTCPDAYLFLESAVRGGISVISNRYGRSNNPLVPGYDATKPTSYIGYYDANNLYAKSMEEKLPLRDFRFLDENEISTFDIMAVDPNGDTGYFVECDTIYPENLHDSHSDLPMLPSHLNITKDILSDVSIHLGEKYGQKFKPQTKLAPTLENKEKYICHSANLRFYLENGLILKKVHRVLSFTQSAWLEPYITLNTERRKKSKNSFEKDYYKLMNNAVSILFKLLIFHIGFHLSEDLSEDC